MWDKTRILVLNEVQPLWLSVTGTRYETGSFKETELLHGRIVPGSKFGTYTNTMNPEQATLYFQNTADYQYVSVSASGSAFQESFTRTLRRDGWESKIRTASFSKSVHASWGSDQPGGTMRYEEGRITFSVFTTERKDRKTDTYGPEMKTIERMLQGSIIPFDGP